MLLIKNGLILTMTSEPVYNGAVLIDGKKIKEIFTCENKIPQMKEKDIVIDAKGGWIMPGLIEAHCHIGISEDKVGMLGEDSNENCNPITPYLSAVDAINPMDPAFHEAIKAGITSVMVGPGSTNVVGGQFIFMKTHGRIIDDMLVLAPAAMKVAFGENPKANFKEFDKSPLTRMSIASMLREELLKAKQYKKNKEIDEIKDEDYRYECWLPVLDKKIPLKAHVHRADDIMTAIRIAKEFDVDITLDHCSEGHLVVDRLCKEKKPVIIGPGLTCRNKIELGNMEFKTAGILSRAGVLVAITTDHPICVIQSLPLCAGLSVKAGLPLKDGLRAITINPAKICKVDDRVGSLQPGLDADIAIFDGNPMETFTNTLYTIIDGKIIYDAEKDSM